MYYLSFNQRFQTLFLKFLFSSSRSVSWQSSSESLEVGGQAVGYLGWALASIFCGRLNQQYRRSIYTKLIMLVRRLLISGFSVAKSKKSWLKPASGIETVVDSSSLRGQVKWKQLLQPVNSDYRQLVRIILNPQSGPDDQNKIYSSLLSLLDFRRNQTKYQPYILALVCVALGESKNTSILHFKERAIANYLSDSMMENQWETGSAQLDAGFNQLSGKACQTMVVEISNQFMEVYAKMEAKKKVKVKTQFLSFLLRNEHYLTDIMAINTILIIVNKIVKDSKSVIETIRFAPFVENVLSKIMAQIEQERGLAMHVDAANSKLKAIVFTTILKSLDEFPVRNRKIEQFFINIVSAPDFFTPSIKDELLMKNYSTYYRYTYKYFSQNGTNPILNRLKLRHKEDEKFRKVFQCYDPRVLGVTFFYMLSGKFAQQYLALPSVVVEDVVVVTQKPRLPKLDEFQCHYFSSNRQKILSQYSLMRNIMVALYPELTGNGSGHVKGEEEPAEKRQLYTDNQFIARVSQALQLLGLKFQREADTSLKRKVDFLLKDNTVIECDGDYHVDYKGFNLSHSTAWRNMTILLEGYRLLVLGIHELNKNRSVHELARLIQKKIRILNDHKAYLAS